MLRVYVCGGIVGVCVCAYVCVRARACVYASDARRYDLRLQETPLNSFHDHYHYHYH